MKHNIFYTLCLFLATSSPLFAGDGSRGEDHSVESNKDSKVNDIDRDKDGDHDRDDRSKADDRHDGDRHDNEPDTRDKGDKKQPCPPPATVISPSVQANGIMFSSVTSSQMTITWTNGNGNGRAVFVKQYAGSSAAPEKNVNYTASGIFGKGQQIGSTNWFCVYNGVATSVTVAGLTAKTTYRAQVCEYNASGTLVAWNTKDVSGNPANKTTTAAIKTNQPPVLVSIGSKSVNEAQNLTFTVSATDPDGTIPVLAAAGLPQNATFTDGKNGTGVFSWTPDYDQAGTYKVTFKTRDGALIDTEVVTITANNVNRPPVLVAIEPKTVDEAAPLSFTVSATDPDGDVPVLSAGNLPAGATLANGTFSWTPTHDQAGSYTVLFKVSDAAQSDSKTATITVVNVNQPPIIATVGEKSVNEMQPLTFMVAATDPDGEIPVLSAENLPAGATFANGSFTWTPAYNQSGSYKILFKASDGQAIDSESVTITVADVNRLPVLAAISDQTINEAQLLSFIVSAGDSDGTLPALSASGLPTGASLIDKGDGTAAFDWTPACDQAGVYTIIVSANDGIATVNSTVSITVNNVNRKPVLKVSACYAGVINRVLQFAVKASDPDGTPVTLTASGVPSGADFVDNGNGTGNFAWTPLTVNPGENVRFIASDGELKDSVTVKVIILEKELSEGLVGRWEFDEGSGTTTLDGSGKDHNGVISGGAAYSDSIPGVLSESSTKSLSFDGVDDYVVANGVGMYDEYTISAWVKPDLPTATYSSIVNYGNRRGMLAMVGSKVYYTMNNGAGTQYYAPMITINNGWHHLAGLMKGDTMRFYVDGQLQSTRIKSGALPGGTTIQIGMENGSSIPYKGLVDDVRFYCRALNGAEIQIIASSDVNLPPGVYAGRDTLVNDVLLPVDLELNGSVMDDRKSVGELGIQWREISGPPNMTFVGGANSLLTTARFIAAGTYVLELKSSDGEKTGYDSITIEVVPGHVDLSLGLGGRWEFDEGSGNVAKDESGQGHNGVISGGAAYSDVVPAVLSGSSMKSLSFDGVNDYVVVKRVAGYEEYTISAWIKPDLPAVTYSSIVNYGDRRGMLAIYGNQVYYTMNNAAGTQYYAPMITIVGGWHFLAGSMRGDTMRFYVDGKLQSTRIKSGTLRGGETIQIGMENGWQIPYKGLVDDVRLYGRALNGAEIQTLANGPGTVTPALATSLSGINSVPGYFEDLSMQIPWGTNQVAGTSAFAIDTIQEKSVYSLSKDALSYSGISSIADLKTFSALDQMFLNPINHDTQIVNISFNAKWDTALAGQFTLVLMDNYPADGVIGKDIGNFTTNPYGTPALTLKLRQSAGGKSVFQYGGSTGNKFDNYNYKWWLPGSVGLTDGGTSLVPSEGPEYPYSSWKGTERPVTDTSWARYTWLVRPDGMELYKNDTLYGTMELPVYSYTAPGYAKYVQFKALRLGWQGQCYVSDIAIAAMPVASAPNRPPQIAFINPLHDTTVLAGSGFYLQADAKDIDGSINRVEFYADNQLLGTCVQPPYAFSWQSVPEGMNEVTVVAVDDKGAVSVGKVIKITTVDRFSVDR